MSTRDEDVAIMNRAEAYARDHVFELAKDLLHLKEKGLRPSNSALSVLTDIIMPLESSRHFAIAESLADFAAIKALANFAPKPIASAPQDGTVILVNDLGGDAIEGPLPWVSAKWCSWVGARDAAEKWEGWVYEDDILQDTRPGGPMPTHWLVPPVPTGAAGLP